MPHVPIYGVEAQIRAEIRERCGDDCTLVLLQMGGPYVTDFLGFYAIGSCANDENKPR
jgi:hypothetical protein